MATFSDKELVGVVLDVHKLAATSYTNLILESSSQFLRNDVVGVLLPNTFNHQKQIYDLAAAKGWYPTQTASQQDITRAQSSVGTQATTSM